MTIDDRAHKAARGLRKAVEALPVPPIAGAGIVAPARRVPFMATMAQAAAALVVIGLAVGYFSAGGFFAPFFGETLAPVGTQDTTATTVRVEAAEPKASTTTTTKPELPPAVAKPVGAETPQVYEVTILSPDDGFETEAAAVLVHGEATPDLHVTVNGRVALRDGEGHWQIEVQLEKGWNTIVAKGFLGDVKAAKASIQVLHEPPVPTTTLPKPPPAEYGVHITTPADGAHVDGSSVTVTGEATPGLTVKVNGIVATWTDTGHWKASVPLVPGWNGIAAKGYDGDTKVAYHAIEVLNGEPRVVRITSPADGAQVLEGSTVLVTGEATAGLAVLVNGHAVDWVDGTHWAVVVPLEPGWNAIRAKGYLAETKVAIDTVEVHRGELVVVPFTVTQMYGSCSEDPPYETFFGTATPNGKVWVQSPYGEKTVFADADGHFEVTIHFSGVPVGKTFEVSVKDYDKHEYRYFSFTYTG